jgi:crotonobetainyl-CoA:carnitine CoA-transferase CaiB-like acyl-CoA transferase
MLVDAGAEVAKVEAGQGDPLRRWSASGSRPEGTDGLLFQFLNASKVGMRQEVSVDALAPILRGAHILIEGGELSSPEISELRKRLPHLSVISITPFGKDGPWADVPWTEFTLQAMCGSTAARGLADREPLHAGGRIGEWTAGVFGALAAAALFVGWESGGTSDHADVSMFESMALVMGAYRSLTLSLSGAEAPAGPSRWVELPSIEPTKDGYVGLCAVTRQQFSDILVMIEHPELVADEHLASAQGRQSRRESFLQMVHAWTAERTTAEVMDLAALLRLPVAPIGEPATMTKIDQFVERGVYRRNTNGIAQPRRPFLIDGLEPPEVGEAPQLDEPVAELAWDPIPDSNDSGPRQLPLEGVRVVDLTAFWAGPAATQMLAALGAEVVKVESIQRPDGMRFSGTAPGRDAWWERGSIFQAVNMNKLGVTLDLSSERGRQILLDLVKDSDVLIENFSPRVLDGFGLTRELLHETNPGLVIARMPAFGLDGPWRDRTGFAQTMEQASGLAWLTGFEDGPPSIPRGPCDPVGGMHVAFAVISALRSAAISGRGAFLECTMVEAALNVAVEIVLEYEGYGAELHRQGNRGPVAAPQGLYPCAADDSWVAIAVRDDQDWRRLQEVLGTPDSMASIEYLSLAGRRRGADDIDAQLREMTVNWDAEALAAGLRASGVPAGRVVDNYDVTSNPQFRHRGFVEAFRHSIIGEHEVIGIPMRLAEWPDLKWNRRPAPMLGEHNDSVLSGVLGMTGEELAELRDTEIIGDRPKGL